MEVEVSQVDPDSSFNPNMTESQPTAGEITYLDFLPEKKNIPFPFFSSPTYLPTQLVLQSS